MGGHDAESGEGQLSRLQGVNVKKRLFQRLVKKIDIFICIFHQSIEDRRDKLFQREIGGKQQSFAYLIVIFFSLSRFLFLLVCLSLTFLPIIPTTASNRHDFYQNLRGSRLRLGLTVLVASQVLSMPRNSNNLLS